MITCGSRFCTRAETKYHPIEGELLGVTWALEKSAYYTLGSDKLLILVDHKPLIGLLTTHNLREIENPRLLHLAERLLRWNFNIQHIAGAKFFAPDALSRSPTQTKAGGRNYTRSDESSRPHFSGSPPTVNSVPVQDQQQSDDLEAQVLATTANTEILITSWPDLRTAGIADAEYSARLNAVNLDTNDNDWPQDLIDYKQHRMDLTSVDGVVIF